MQVSYKTGTQAGITVYAEKHLKNNNRLESFHFARSLITLKWHLGLYTITS